MYFRRIHQEPIHQVHLSLLKLHFLSDAARHGQSEDRVPDSGDPGHAARGPGPVPPGGGVGEDGARLLAQLR